MKKHLKHAGKYELYETSDGKTALSLDRSNKYLILNSNYGDILAICNSDSSRKRILKKGMYYMIDFNHDPDFGNILHLFLQNGKNEFDEWILPDDLPTDANPQVILSIPVHKTNLKNLLRHLYNEKIPYLQHA